MVPRIVFFLLTTVVIVGGASVYVHRRAAELVRLGPWARRALAAVLACGLVLAVASRVLDRWLPARLLAPLGVAGAAIIVGVFLSAILLASVDLLTAATRTAWSTLRRAAPPSSPAPSSAPPEAAPGHVAEVEGLPDAAVSRRGFLHRAAQSSAIAVGAGSALYGTLLGRHDYTLEELPVAIPGLSRRLDGYTLVQLSDIHLGLFVGEPEMRAAEELVRKARPDLVVLTGDLIDHDASYTEALGRLVRRLSAHARDGIVAVPGNHDHYTGIEKVVSTLERAGATVLRNGGRVIGGEGAGIALLGVDDPAALQEDEGGGGVGPDLPAALAAVPAAADLPRILLCHNPAFFPRAAGRIALQLSGHTHGGQVDLGGIWAARLVLGHPYVAGAYERAGSRLYVNRGFGTAGPPARVGAPPEVTRIVLTS